METREYLGLIIRYDRMVENKLLDIEKMRTMVTSTSVSQKDVNVQTSTDKDKLGSIVTKIVQLEKETDELIDKRFDIVRKIEKMPNLNEYDVLIQKYVLKKQIKELELDNASTYKQKLRFLKKAEKSFEELYGKEYLFVPNVL
jgi:hypothetical protein